MGARKPLVVLGPIATIKALRIALKLSEAAEEAGNLAVSKQVVDALFAGGFRLVQCDDADSLAHFEMTNAPENMGIDYSGIER